MSAAAETGSGSAGWLDREYIVAKAVRDGVIDAQIDHELQYVVSSETADVYSTTEPMLALQRRIQFCNATLSEARKSMRYGVEDQKNKDDVVQEDNISHLDSLDGDEFMD